MKTKVISIAVAIALLASNAFSYGPQGHRMVGAIGARRLAKADASAFAKVNTLLDGVSLADAALLPDEIKGWDTAGKPGPLPSLNGGHEKIMKQLVAFWKANRAMEDGQQLHRVYHFTDVPVLDEEKYGDGDKGRFEQDIVHMIPFCINVLTVEGADVNERKITKAVAIILLAHYLGDIHQPLHVGAEYFGTNRKPINPDKGGKFFGDEGGNNLNLSLLKNGKPVSTGKLLHGYWDNNAALTALKLMQTQFKNTHHNTQPATEEQLAQEFADLEPDAWKLSSQLAVKDWAEAWANDILPLARDAHQRLEFNITIVTKHGKKEAAGTALERNASDGVSYQDWSGNVAFNEIHKGGWRLAALLAKVVK